MDDEMMMMMSQVRSFPRIAACAGLDFDLEICRGLGRSTKARQDGRTRTSQPTPHQMNRIASLHMIRLTYSSPLTTRSIDDDDSVRCVTRSFENSMARWLMIEVRVCLIVRPAVLQYSAHHIESACPRTYDDDKVILSPCN